MWPGAFRRFPLQRGTEPFLSHRSRSTMFTKSRSPRASLAAGLFLLATAGALAPAEAAVLARVDGVDITDEDVKIAAEDLGANLPAQLQGPARDAYILDYLIDVKLVAKKAEKDKLAEGPNFARQLAYYRDKILMERVMADAAKAGITDEAMKKVYDDAAKAQKPETEVRARHILVASEDEAKAALKRIEAGEDFAKVATELSKDPGSEGGDLGYFTKDKMVPEFADAAFKLNVGQVSQPVKSQFGWHIIKVEDKREKQFPPFDQVKDQVARYLSQKGQADMITKLRGEAKIEKTDAAPKADAPKTP
jgi:peptidyl-prolyl cis-trans isomerase C